MESKRHNKLVNIIDKQTYRYREQTSGYQWEKGRGGQDRSRRVRGTGFPGGAGGEEPTCQCRRCAFDSGSGRSSGVGNPLQYSCLGNSMDLRLGA